MAGFVVCSILEASAPRTLLRLRQVPAGAALVEIRGDHLDAGEIGALTREAGRDTIVTVRSRHAGGGFAGSEAERRTRLLAALAAGARFVDVELDSPLADLAAGPLADRVILSHHGAPCSLPELAALCDRMATTGAAVLKIVPDCDSAGRAGAVRDLLQSRRGGRSLACFATGRAGALTRILAPCWGSWATYGSVAAGRETATGQLTAADLLDTYGVVDIGPATRRFALIGADLARSPSPAMHRAAALAAGVDARYLPLEVRAIDECLPLVGRDGACAIEALGVTMPFKEEAARRCVRLDPVAARAGAVNTVLLEPDGWAGFNTDGPAILDLARRHLEPRECEVAIVGAGGTARAAAAVLAAAGARVTLYNRGLDRARAAGRDLGVRAAPLERLPQERWDLLVQATPLGRGGESVLPADALRGRCVIDAVYGVLTPLVRQARSRGLVAVDGLAVLVAQAVLQFQRMTGEPASAAVMTTAAGEWLARTVDVPGSAE